ncbi:MAG: DUF4755 domain-containing protein [Lysobacter sp.]
MELLKWLPFATIFVVLPILGLFWLVRDALARLGSGQAWSWGVLYVVGCLFAMMGQWVVLLLWLVSRPAKLGALADDIDRLLPQAPANMRHMFFGTAIAIDPQCRRIAMINHHGVGKIFDFDEVRHYRWAIDRGVHVDHGGLSGAMASNRNNRNKLHNTGLFLEVRDVDHPSWQIRFRRESELKRWFEILNQAFEGRLMA